MKTPAERIAEFAREEGALPPNYPSEFGEACVDWCLLASILLLLVALLVTTAWIIDRW